MTAVLDLPRLGRYLADRIGGFEPAELTAELVDGGRSNLTYALRAGGHAWALRRPPLGTVAPSANDVHREHRITSALAGSGVPVPGPVLYCADDGVIGAPFSLAEWVDGVVLRSPEQLAAMAPAAVRGAARMMIDELLRLHTVDATEFGIGRPEGYLGRQVDRWRRQWEVVATRDSPEAEALQRRLGADVPAQSPGGVVHGDFRLDNLIFTHDLSAVAALLDWEMATTGDPLADLGLLLVYCDPVSDPVLQHGCPTSGSTAFPTRDELVAAYAAGSNRDLDRLDFYEALGYYKLAVVAEGIHKRYLEGMTVGTGFETVGGAVPGLLAAGLARLRQ
ncbi:phosphotransferase family protein [Dactylosporangium sucinum]|uniref:Acyl-CoA dehydrogenase n=1 Tax=Dactylosporangium sucinum TaxID=1424081 RepID=A0A917UEM4_9ACTN|nr:phosphotransferase family protein [Dactylosporangium sucinum]GGM83373.1 acyl-CoA dehydrogenase [Dactylosporangium sucinum]